MNGYVQIIHIVTNYKVKNSLICIMNMYVTSHVQKIQCGILMNQQMIKNVHGIQDIVKMVHIIIS